MANTEAKPHLPRVLVNARRGYALEVMRGHKFSHIINADSGTISYDRVALEKLNEQWKDFSCAPEQVFRFCDVCLNSYRPKTERTLRTLREIKSMTIDVAKATTQELIDFHNANAEKAKVKPVKKFADRKTAEERVTKLLATLNAAPTGDADAPLPADAAPTSSTTKTKGTTMSKKAKATKAAKPTKSTKKAATPKKKAGTISSGVKASWGNKKVATARSIKHKVKVGGEIYRSVAEAFQKLKLDFAKHVKFRAELKQSANGRATFEGKTFTLVHETE